jgi:hypothetical protein
MITTDGRSSVEIAIEHLVLDGFEPQQSQAIASTLKEKLAGLIEERGLPGDSPQPIQAGQLDAGSIHLPEGASPARIGAQIAEAIYNRLAHMIGRGKQDD